MMYNKENPTICVQACPRPAKACLNLPRLVQACPNYYVLYIQAKMHLATDHECQIVLYCPHKLHSNSASGTHPTSRTQQGTTPVVL